MLNEILFEKPVDSSWLVDISYNRKTNTARMITQHRGRQTVYYITGISRREFDKWHKAPSQGKYWHKHINGYYDVKREI